MRWGLHQTLIEAQSLPIYRTELSCSGTRLQGEAQASRVTLSAPAIVRRRGATPEIAGAKAQLCPFSGALSAPLNMRISCGLTGRHAAALHASRRCGLETHRYPRTVLFKEAGLTRVRVVQRQSARVRGRTHKICFSLSQVPDSSSTRFFVEETRASNQGDGLAGFFP